MLGKISGAKKNEKNDEFTKKFFTNLRIIFSPIYESFGHKKFFGKKEKLSIFQHQARKKKLSVLSFFDTKKQDEKKENQNQILILSKSISITLNLYNIHTVAIIYCRSDPNITLIIKIQ